MSYRDDLAALSARHAALETEVAQKLCELAQATQLLDEARARARLPVLDDIRVAASCTADWARMIGDDRVRFCGDCRQNVYNLSGLTRDEAEALIIGLEGNLCVRYFQRTDGTILLADDCAVGERRRRRRRRVIGGVAALLAGAGALGWQLAPAPEQAPSLSDREQLELQLRLHPTMGKYEGARRATPSEAAQPGEPGTTDEPRRRSLLSKYE